MRLCKQGHRVLTDTMQTVTDARTYSVGECAAHRGIAYGLVAPLFERQRSPPTIWRSSVSVATLGSLTTAC
jgi:nitrite reductase (NADH) large subunit